MYKTAILWLEIHNSDRKKGIPMGIDPAPFWANLLIYTYENEYISELISNDKVKAHHFHAAKRFIDVYKYIYSRELELKIEHSGTHATFLNLDNTVKDGVFIYKLLISVMLFPFFLLFVCLTLIVASSNQYFILLLLVNLLR